MTRRRLFDDTKHLKQREAASRYKHGPRCENIKKSGKVACWKANGMVFSVECYDALLALQKGLCRICRLPRQPGARAFPLDHDHETGEIRGVLCHKCNTGLESFNDSILVLETAIRYLKGEI